MKITENVRKYAAEQAISEEDALKGTSINPHLLASGMAYR